MSVFASFSILILVVLIILFLQLTPGIFSLFYHSASGKYSKYKVDKLSLFFIVGLETMLSLLFIFLNIIIFALPHYWFDLNNQLFAWIISGILISESLLFFFLYYRKGYGTKLFISRKMSHNIQEKTKTVKNSSDAFVLGFVSGIPELLFTLPIYFIFLAIAYDINPAPLPYSALILSLIIISVIPLFSTHIFFRTNHTLADFERFRVKNKNFFRLFISLLYLLTAIIIITFRIIN